jgi:hypothetical protein
MASHELLSSIKKNFLKRTTVIEIGSSREIDRSEKSSTRYFCELSRDLGFEFYSVDFAEESYRLAKEIAGDCAVHSDGAAFLKTLPETTKISVLYLDNFDVIYSDEHKIDLLQRVSEAYDLAGEEINNERSAEVHLEQMTAALPLMAKKSVVICDDTLLKSGIWWGKCASVVPYLENLGWTIHKTGKVGCMLVSPALKKSINNRKFFTRKGLSKRVRKAMGRL